MGISRKQALDCLQSTDLIGIGMEADSVRRSLHPENVASYAVACRVVTGEALAEFEGEDFRALKSTGAESNEAVLTVVPGTTLADLQKATATLMRRFPSVHIHGPSASEILQLAEAAGVSPEEAVGRLGNAGMLSLAGDDLCAGKDSDRILDLHRCAHRAGLRTTSGMIFGAGETLEKRVEHMFAVRNLQDETGGFTAFASGISLPAAGAVEAPTAVESMRTLAVSRMVLDNIENIEAKCFAQGLKVVQMALRFGANDAGAIPAGGARDFTEEDLRRVIRDAGFQPVERDTLYRMMYLSN